MIQCIQCSKATEAKRLPPGWHRNPSGDSVCGDCWSKCYILRAITIPVAGPVDGQWPELREAMKTCWQTATRLSNWATRELAKADIVRTADIAKLPKMPPVHPRGLYALANDQGFDMGPDSQSASCILRHAEQKYRATRYESVWLGQRSLANYRYPTPYPVHNASWHASLDGDGRTLISVRLAGRRWTLRLRGGHQFRRQLAAVAKLIDGQAVAGEMALYQQRANAGDHRNGMAGRDGGGQQCATRLMCKMVMYLPRESRPPATGTLHVKTDKDSLLLALDIKGERLWIEHTDQVRRWTAEHYRKLNRWADDQKAEQRPTASYQSRREAAAQKYRRRLKSCCQEVAAHLVRFASRRRYAAIRYDDTERGYCERFPWEQLRTAIEQKADEYGLGFERSSGEKTPGTARVTIT